MQDTTNHNKKVAIICAAVIVSLLGIFLIAFLFPLLGAAYGELMAVGIVLVYVFINVAVIVGVIIALRQRLWELESGEEEDAKKY